ncbi:alpha-hydroxy-acid oxidizing protein [Nocardia sp. NPDC058705]|uniref:alpha-hydroxy-acid oxidizing protein n=1 Tax=Nocardia sp. NPDC058705 TaxID=3346609 RepID=UPI00369307FB
MAYGGYQDEIRQQHIMTPLKAAELEEHASRVMSPQLWSYVAGGAGDETTQRANIDAFDRWGLIPRMFSGTDVRDLSISLFGMKLQTPIFTAPIGVLGLCTPDGHGDLAAARTSAATGVPLTLCTFANDAMEDVTPLLGDTPGFFQLYVPNDRELAASFMKRAESAGCRAIVVTLDQPVTGWRPRDAISGYSPPLHGQCLANYTTDPVFRAGLNGASGQNIDAVVKHFLRVFPNRVEISDLVWLRTQTELPLIVKGICHPDDVRRAKDAGVDGIYCSNHGGRQANGGLPALDSLPAVVAAADGLPVLFDSGVRDGIDVIKALAMGASAVGVGRPYAYGLALNQTHGASQVLRSILAEMDLTMAVDGYPSVGDLNPAALQKI